MSKMREGVLAVSALAVLSACNGMKSSKMTQRMEERSGVAAASLSGVTYHGDVKKIIDQKCAICHSKGGAGPQSFETYSDVKTHALAMKASIVAKRMPPWKASTECADYKYDFSLSKEETKALIDWVDQGAAEGQAPAQPQPAPSREAKLSRVDHRIKMPSAYEPKTSPDEYRCFVLDWPEKDVAFVTGFGTLPGNKAIVHHAIAFVAPPAVAAEVAARDGKDGRPGYECFGGPEISGIPAWLGAWVPGAGDIDYPAGTGLKVEPGSKIVLQMHYNTASSGLHEHGRHGGGGVHLHDDGTNHHKTDQTTLLVKVDKSVEKQAYMLPWTNIAWTNDSVPMLIPAGQKNVTHEFAADPSPLLGGSSFDVHMAALHMHQLGNSGSLKMLDKDDAGNSREKCLLDIPSWDFHWQSSYWLKRPIKFKAGNELRIQCSWDNTEAKAGKSPVDVKWGEGTGDEMCLGLLYITLE